MNLPTPPNSNNPRPDLQKQLNALFAEMNKNVQIPTDKSVSPIEEKLKEIMNKVPNPLNPMPGALAIPGTAPEKPQLIAIDGFILQKDFPNFVSYALVKLSKTNPEIASLLGAFEFEMQDENGTQVYPIKKAKKK